MLKWEKHDFYNVTPISYNLYIKKGVIPIMLKRFGILGDRNTISSLEKCKSIEALVAIMLYLYVITRLSW